MSDIHGSNGCGAALAKYAKECSALRSDNARLWEALSVCEDENQKYLKDKLNAEAALEKLRDMQIVETLPIIDAALAKPEGGAS